MRRHCAGLMGGLLSALFARRQRRRGAGGLRPIVVGMMPAPSCAPAIPRRARRVATRDPRCRAWAFSYPTTENANAVCWLKSHVTARVAAGCCVAGVRGAGVIERREGPVEFGIDRTGGDFRNIELPADATGNSCKATCESDAKCRAWTYRRPGYGGPSASCYLKDRITRPQRKPCCISEVVR